MYSGHVIKRAEQILGYGIGSVAGDRTYRVIDGIIYTDLFSGTPTLQGFSGTFKTRFNGKQGTAYFNEIILDSKCKNEITITAAWGSNSFLSEINKLLAWIKDDDFVDNVENAGIQSKKIEDFSVTYKNEEEGGVNTVIDSTWGYYIRKPLIVGISKEHKNDWRYF